MKTLLLATSVAVSFAMLAAPSPAAAQIPGLYNLPKNDFLWRWGDENEQRDVGDFEVSGHEAGFTCDLIGEMSPARTFSHADMRALESELRTRPDFIYAVSVAMNELDLQRDLDWAVLTCKRHQAQESTPEEKAENEARAREKMQREVERRRARQEDAKD